MNVFIIIVLWLGVGILASYGLHRLMYNAYNAYHSKDDPIRWFRDDVFVNILIIIGGPIGSVAVIIHCINNPELLKPSSQGKSNDN